MKTIFFLLIFWGTALGANAQSTIPYLQPNTKAPQHNYRDAFQVQKVELEAKLLSLQIRFGGGCQKHDFYYSMKPVGKDGVLEIIIYHNAHNDHCEALLSKNIVLDLSLAAQHGQAHTLKIFCGERENPVFTYKIPKDKKLVP